MPTSTTGQPDEGGLEPGVDDEVTPEALRGAERSARGGDNPGEPTPGSDNDGPEEGYTPPSELPPRRAPGPPAESR